ncbi:hypothetical protein ACFU9Y_06085 [Streptomyces sp. NPDC057621]|uniref:hypothetical protein n=1 Tax=Streptomyces sp. NPDC057621 TaxID=3346186 RepID=UPI003695F4B1
MDVLRIVGHAQLGWRNRQSAQVVHSLREHDSTKVLPTGDLDGVLRVGPWRIRSA